MLEYYIGVGSNLLTFIFYLIIIFLIFSIKKRVDDKIAPTLRFIIIALFSIMIARMLNLLTITGFIPEMFSYVKELFIFLFSLFLLIAAINFHQFLLDALNHFDKCEKKEVPKMEIIKNPVEKRFKKIKSVKLNYDKILSRINRDSAKRRKEYSPK